MPVDFIKARLLDIEIPKLLVNKHFRQTREIYKDNNYGECSKVILQYKNLTITIYKYKVAILTGSLHYFFNDGKHNYNNFTFTNLISTLEEIANLLDIHLHQLKLQNIEFGFNIKLPYKVSNITDNLLINNKKTFLKPYDFDYRKAMHQRYWVKVYNKGNQFELSENLLRVEIKHIKMIDLNRLGLYNCLDLTNRALHNRLLDNLLEKWNNTLLYDFTINKTQLTPQQFKKSLEYQNPNYWLNLTPQQRTRQKKTLQNLSIEFGANTHQQIKDLIQNQFNIIIDL